MSLADRLPPSVVSAAATAGTALADLGALLARLTIGQAFMLTGWGKLNNHDRTADFFAGLGIPAPGFHAYAIGGLELVGGALLIIGLGVRPVALPLLGTMVVAILTADRPEFLAALAISPDKGLTDVVPWMFGLILVWLLAHGGGRLSADRVLCGGKPAGNHS